MSIRPSVKNTSVNDIRIRSFRPEDTEQVRELFLQGMMYSPGAAMQVALVENLYSPRVYAACALAISAILRIVHLGHPCVGGVVFAGIAGLFLVYRWLLVKSYASFCDSCLKTDLADIATHYKVNAPGPNDGEGLGPGPSGFWVGYREVPGGRGQEIVGCIGLDCRVRDGGFRADLRRMTVSAGYRKLGVAGMLIGTLLAHAREHTVPVVYLSTNQYQRSAIRMYERFGWVESRREYVRDGIINLLVFEYLLCL